VPRLVRVSLVAAIAGGLLAACAPGTVRLAFAAHPGARFRYAVDVHAETVTVIPGQPGSRQVTDQHLTADHRVVSADRSGVVVDVRLQGEGVPERTFRVRLDRTASLTQVERVDDLPVEVLGELGLSEVFPAAAGAPPNRPLRPGTRWSLDQPVRLNGAPPARLTGSGSLDRLGVVNGRRVATISTTYTLPVRQQVESSTLDGSARTEISATRSVSDGAIEVVSALTMARFSLTVNPPPGINGVPIAGTLTVEVRSTTRRTG
jgi:hypothetical protein